MLPNRSDAVHGLINGIEKFSLSFLLRTAIDSGEKSFVVSPYSAWSMLTLMCKAAEDDTLLQLSQVLRHPGKNQKLFKEALDFVEGTFQEDSSSVNIKSQNFIINNADAEISPEFENNIPSGGNTRIITTRFDDPNAYKTINKAVFTATRGKVDDMLEEKDFVDAKVILASAMSFKTKWAHPFNVAFTRKAPFYDHKHRELGKVDMMVHTGHFKFANVSEFQACALELPLGRDNRLCMIALIPHEGIALKDLYVKFTLVPIDNIFEKLDEAHKRDVESKTEVHFPRFNITRNFNLHSILLNMGIQDIFDPTYAKIPKISSRSDVWISSMMHKAHIEVAEGSDSDIVYEYSSRQSLPKFVTDRPFLYMIIEKATNVIILGGVYGGP